MKPASSIACCIVTCLALSACPSESPATKTEPSPAASRKPDRPEPKSDRVEFGSVELCRSFPIPQGYRWSQATIDAFCADEHSETLSWEDIRRMVDEGRGKHVDAEFDRILADYFAGKLPEGTARYIYVRFDSADDQTARLADDWLRQSPRSPHALTARGIHRVARGAKARGSKVVSATPESSFERMHAELALAKRDLQAALAANPKIPTAYEFLINAVRMEGPRRMGVSAMRDALKVDAANFYVRAAFMFMNEPRWGGSFEDMDSIAAEARPLLERNPRLANLKGIAMGARAFDDHGDQNYSTSYAAYDRAAAESPVWLNMTLAAYAASRTGQYQRCVELYSQMLRFSPQDADTLQYRAGCYTSLKRYEDSRADLDIALKHSPRHMAALREYGYVLVAERKYREAEKKLRLAHEIDPADQWVLQRLAWVYVYGTREYEKARPLVNEYLEKNPRQGDAWLLKADLLQDLNEPGVREAAENFVRYADLSNSEQANALPKVKAWLAKQDAGSKGS